MSNFGPNNDVHSTALTFNTQSGTVVYNWNQGSCNVYQQQHNVRGTMALQHTAERKSHIRESRTISDRTEFGISS